MNPDPRGRGSLFLITESFSDNAKFSTLCESSMPVHTKWHSQNGMKIYIEVEPLFKSFIDNIGPLRQQRCHFV